MTLRIASALSTLALGAGLARPALADPQECIAANERGGAFKARGEFSAARNEYQACAADSCPKVIRDECAELIGTIEAATPTVVLVAVDAQGNDAVDVSVEVDGRPHAAGIDGRAASLDPGEHAFRFQRGADVREIRAVIREGEKNRSIRVQFEARATETPTAPAPGGASAPAAAEGARPVPTLAYVLAGVGVVALGSFTYFAIAGNARKNDLQERCAPNCTLDEANAMQARYLVADISLAVAAVSLGGATYLYVTRPPASGPSPSSRLLPAEGLQLGIRGRF